MIAENKYRPGAFADNCRLADELPIAIPNLALEGLRNYLRWYPDLRTRLLASGRAFPSCECGVPRRLPDYSSGAVTVSHRLPIGAFALFIYNGF
jgi:hypothetical protein